MKTFKFTANISFQAKNIDDAFECLAVHFLVLSGWRESVVLEELQIEGKIPELIEVEKYVNSIDYDEKSRFDFDGEMHIEPSFKK